MEAGCSLVTDWHAGCVDREPVRCYGGNSRQSRAWLFPEKRGISVCVHLCSPVPKQACEDPGTANQGVTVMLGERWPLTAQYTHTHWHSRTLSLSAEGHCVFVWRRPPGIIGLCLHVRAFMLAQIRPPVCIILLLLYPFSFLTLTCLMLLFVGFSFWCNKFFFVFVRVSLMFSLKSFSYFLFCFVICFLSLLFILALRPFSYPQWRFCKFMAITLLCFIHIETVQNTHTKIFNIVM